MGFMQDRLQQFFDAKKGWNDLMTYARQGLAELRSLFHGQHMVPTDPGMWGNKLPQEIYNDRNTVSELDRSPNHEQALKDLNKQYEPTVSSRDGVSKEPERDIHVPDKE